MGARSPLLVALLLIGCARDASAQLVGPIDAGAVHAATLANRCTAGALTRDTLVEQAARLLHGETPPTPEVLAGLEAAARDRATASPEDADVQYALATILGVETDLASGKARLGLAEALFAQVKRVLELDPSHPGAHHILGRLNAGVMRMSRFDRFLAQRLLGAEVIGEASWAEARSHLEAAEAGDPCVPDHHYELARLYLERGEESLAYREMGHALELTALNPDRWEGVRARVALLGGS